MTEKELKNLKRGQVLTHNYTGEKIIVEEVKGFYIWVLGLRWEGYKSVFYQDVSITDESITSEQVDEKIKNDRVINPR